MQLQNVEKKRYKNKHIKYMQQEISCKEDMLHLQLIESSKIQHTAKMIQKHKADPKEKCCKEQRQDVRLENSLILINKASHSIH